MCVSDKNKPNSIGNIKNTRLSSWRRYKTSDSNKETDVLTTYTNSDCILQCIAGWIRICIDLLFDCQVIYRGPRWCFRLIQIIDYRWSALGVRGLEPADFGSWPWQWTGGAHRYNTTRIWHTHWYRSRSNSTNGLLPHN